MDVQGSEYHLIHGPADWSVCLDADLGLPLAEVGVLTPTPELSRLDSSWEYDLDRGWLRLRRDTPLFCRAGRSEPMKPTDRRGAGRDLFGNWFWIDADERTIRWRPVADDTASLWWSVDELHASCTCLDPAAAPPTVFHSVAPCPLSGVRLRGLTVTTGDYLVAGYAGDGERGLLLFDLTAGAGPTRLIWPAGTEFAPFDLADTSDGGVLILDAEHSQVWRLDRHFRLRGVEQHRSAVFAGLDGSAPIEFPEPAEVTPDRLAAADGRPLHPVSIEPGPDDSVLIMQSDPAVGFSVLYCFDGPVLRWSRSLADIVEVIDPDDPEAVSRRYSQLGFDFCFLAGPPATGPLPPPMLYVADSEGNQVVAFRLDPETGDLIAQDDFLPLRRWAGRGLVRAAEGAWYDFGERWIPLAVFTENRFATSARLFTPPPTGDLPGEPFDSRRPGCVWHRLILDGLLPTQTAITVRARAADDISLLEIEPWLSQPVPYRRGRGSELPWAETDGLDCLELLFQQVIGRYLQLEITASGGGRSTPALRSVRAWFPRFSYVEHYLPAVYAESDAVAPSGPARFLERFLANPEGLLTEIEEKIEHSHLLLDHRTARSADLDWLASWFGLILDPAWTTQRRRFLIGHIDAFYRRRGTLAGLLAMLRVFFDPDLDDATIFAVGQVPATRSRIRLIESFLLRSPTATLRSAAHRFEVQVPGRLSAAETEMVSRIVEQNKPAHTAFALTAYDELFVIGRARLGLDTELADGLRFGPVTLGRSRLNRGYLSPLPVNLVLDQELR